MRTQTIASPDPSLTFINEIEAAREVVEILRNEEKVDIVIGLTHIGDVKESPDHITSRELAEAAPGIDIIVDGHSHSFMDAPLKVGETYIVSANEWGKYVGQGKLSVSGEGKLVAFEWAPIAIGPDPEVLKILEPYVAEAEASLKEVVGEASETFVFGDRLTRKTETALGDLICDANVWYFREVYNQEIDFAFHNGGNMRAELPQGPITREQILTILPFENYLFIVSLKGQEILDLFNFIASIPQGSGGWPQVSGAVRYTIDYTGGTGKLKDLTINGEPVDPEKTYRFCTNDYLLKGGDGYTVLTRSEDPFNTSLLLSYVVIEYIKAQGNITPATDGRITVIEAAAPKAAVEAPAAAPEASANAVEAPTAAPEGPADTAEAPVATPEAPADAAEAPTAAPETPTAAPEVPTAAPEAPAATPEAPADAAEAPVATPEAPADAVEAPAAAVEASADAAEAPAATPEAPAEAAEAPAATPEAPAATPEAPAGAAEAPVATPEAPATTPEAPADTAEAPAAAPEAPADATEVPAATPEAPADTAEVPAAAPEAPADTAEAPADAAEAPAATPEAAENTGE